MAPLPDVPNVLRVAFVHTLGTNPNVVTRMFIHFTGSAPTTAQLNTFCTACATAWNSNMASLADADVTLTEVTAIDLTSPTAAEGSATVSHAGTRSAGALPADIAVVVAYEILRRYRGGHARGYWPMGGETDLSGERVWGASFLTAMETGITALVAAIVAAGWSGAGTLAQYNVGYYSGFSVVTNPLTHRARNVPTLLTVPHADPVTSTIVRPTIGSQRKRLRH